MGSMLQMVSEAALPHGEPVRLDRALRYTAPQKN